MKIFIRTKVDSINSFIELALKYNTGIELSLSFQDIDKGFNFDILKGVDVTVHAPFFDVSIASHNPYVRNRSIEILKDTVKMCDILNPYNIVVHHNYSPFVYNFDENYYSNRFFENFSKVLEDKKGNYSITFENVFETDSSIGKKIIELFKDEGIGLCFDCGHFNLFSGIPLKRWLDDWGDKIYEMHIHNNYGYRDDHNPLDMGVIDIKRLLQIYKPKYLTIENRNIEDTVRSLEFLGSMDVGS
ncbi:MAG: sugar phosphate isomerase/epimerase [Deferribacterales bacterium]